MVASPLAPGLSPQVLVLSIKVDMVILNTVEQEVEVVIMVVVADMYRGAVADLEVVGLDMLEVV